MAGQRGVWDVGRWIPVLTAGEVVGLVGIAAYAWSADSASVLAVALLVAGAAFLVGALLGFLFGIPRSLALEGATPVSGSTEGAEIGQRPASYRSNTNLEQISDWLTKIIVGVGLVELGTLVAETEKLVNFLAPALGDEPSSPAFALALLVFYSISGFLITYLITRVYLGRVFARADELMRYVDERIDEVRESQRAQEERDVEALALTNRQLEPGGAEVEQDELNAAVTAASPVVRAQIFSRASQQRRRRDPDQTARTIGVFRALVAADTERRFHGTHAQLGYALKDKADPDFGAAEAELDAAISIRDRLRERGFYLYELNRALCRIETDPGKADGQPSSDELRERIVADLNRAARSPFLRRQILNNDTIKSWLGRNELTPDIMSVE